MIQTYPCPDATRWQALLADADPADSAELEAHLAGCPRCRTVLDELAVGESGWLRDAGRLVSSTANDPEMTKTLHRLRDYWPDDAHGPPIPLDFLTPSDQPGLLGTLGRYQVLEVIGRGAMGIVLKAIDPDLLRPVAIKVMAPYLAPSGTARQRFLREARAAAAVSHDHVVTIHAVEAAELPYLVMEFVSGISLQARLDRDGPLSANDIARIGLQAAHGLTAAHAVGLVHRDIKPSNILLENGVERVKITDFGLARAADDARLTQSGTAAGTPLYMSPEQARGETVDHRSDLFSLGAVLYTLATGFPPFRAGSTMGVLNRIANDPPRPIRETVPDFPAALEGIIMQLLEKDPDRRFQVAADVTVRLTGYLADPQPGPRRPRRPIPKVWAGLVPILAGIVVLGTILYFRTSKGTLVVEVNDPAVAVRIDGDELTITGAGPQVIHLKPGTYHVNATRDGKPVPVEPQVVTIERNGKQVVKVTVEPAAAAARRPAAKDAARAEPQEPPPAERSPKIDPAWDAVLKPLGDQIRSLAARLAGTRGNRFITLPGPVTDLDKATADLAEQDRARVKRLLALRDQFGLAFPQAQKKAVEVGQARQQPGAGNKVERLENELRVQHEVLAKVLIEMESLAADLGARPAKAEAAPNDADREVAVRTLAEEFTTLTDGLARTALGKVLTLSGLQRDTFELGLRDEDGERVRRLIAAHDQFRQNDAQFRKEIGRWEQAEANARTARLKFAAGTISGLELEKAELALKDADRPLAAAEKGMRRALADLQAVARELKLPASNVESEFKKQMAEYDAVVLRLAKTSVGRLLTTTKAGRWSETDIKEAVGAHMATAVRLLKVRDQIIAQATEIETLRLDLAKWRDHRLTDELARGEQDVRVQTEVIRGLLPDLKKLADEIDPPPGPDADFNALMAEYDALVLRLAEVPVGQVLALFPPDKKWDAEQVQKHFGGNALTAEFATWLLGKHDQIRDQADRARTAMTARANFIRRKAERTELKNPPDDGLSVDDAIKTHEHELKLRTVALRGLIGEVKKFADENAPKKGK